MLLFQLMLDNEVVVETRYNVGKVDRQQLAIYLKDVANSSKKVGLRPGQVVSGLYTSFESLATEHLIRSSAKSE